MRRHVLFPASVAAATLAVVLGCSSTETGGKAPAGRTSTEGSQAAKPPAEATTSQPASGSESAAIASAPSATGALSAAAGVQSFAYFYRKKSILGGALNTSVHVDKIEVADLDPGTYVKVPLQPGKHAFYSDEEGDELKVDVDAGKEYYFRVDLQAGMWKGHGVLNRVEAAEGSAEFEKWKLKLAEDIRKPEMVVKDPRKP
jgi:hypothetical protein